MDASRLASSLNQAPLLGGLDARALSLIAAVSTVRHVEAGRSIYRDGDEANAMYIVEQGKVSIRRSDGDLELGSGDTFGGMALLNDTPRACDAYATSDCDLVKVDRAGFRDLLFLHKEIAYEVLWAAVQRLGPLCDPHKLVWY